MKTIAVVGCGFPQLGLLRAGRELGVELVGLDRNPEAVGVPLASRFLPVSTGDPEAVARAARDVGAAAIVSTGSELALATTARASALTGLPFYTDPDTVFRCQNKDAMRGAYARAGLPTPRFSGCRSVAEAQAFVARVGLPVVVKPANGWGQRGVSRVRHAADLPAAVEAAAAASHGGGGVVVEEHLEGAELSVNGWVESDQLVAYAVTDREVFPGEKPLGVMRSEVAPSRLDGAAVQAAIEAAAKAAAALGLTRGPCYTQVCVTERGPVVFETAARCGGGFDADVTKLVSGVDLYRRIFGVALGDLDLEREGAAGDKHPAALVRFVAPPTGTVKAVGGVDEARASEGVIDAAIYAQPGAKLEGLVNAASRVAHVLAVGATRDRAVANADAAESLLRITI